MRACEATRRDPVTVAAGSTLTEVAGLMDGSGVGAVVVVDGQRPIGIVTDRDIVVRAVARRQPADSRVDSVMSTDVITLDADANIQRAHDIFRTHPIRRLPLVRKGEVAGMITVDDLLIDSVASLGDLVRPITGETIFAHRQPGMIATP
jgi:CBS domain-containing protein